MKPEPNEDFPEPFDLSPPTRSKREGSDFATGFLVAIAAVGASCFVLCCGGGIVAFWFATQEINEEIASQLRENPILVDQLGPIERIEMDLVASLATEEPDSYVFDVEGTDGKGVIYCESYTTDDGSEWIAWAELKLPEGKTVVLLVEEE